VIDRQVSVDDDIVEVICGFEEEHVQSCEDIFAFNKV
jgi:hypothetical protein